MVPKIATIIVIIAELRVRVGKNVPSATSRQGIVTVRGKGGQRAQMPLPAEVGRAIATYLKKGRPGCTSRRPRKGTYTS